MLKRKLKEYCVLDELGISRIFIICPGFDSTSVDTELRNGIVVRLKKEFGRQLLQLPCRHHIHELLCAAATKLVYGDSKSPKQEAFTSLIAAWLGLDKSNYGVYQPSRTPQNQCEHAVKFKNCLKCKRLPTLVPQK